MSQAVSILTTQERPPAVTFCAADEAAGLVRARTILGLGIFGDRGPAGVPDTLPVYTPELGLLGPRAVCEVWTAPGPVSYGELARCKAAWTDGLLFGVRTISETSEVTLEQATRQVYTDIFSVLGTTPYRHLLRTWNYFPRITAVERGQERYQRFNVARHEAFTAHRLAVEAAPAASGVGTRGGPLTVMFIAARLPGIPIENPRQVSAYHYPERYGPRSPTFSRALLAGPPGDARLFLSGTASIVGHESVHLGDPAGQVSEAFENLEALQSVAKTYGFESSKRFLKAYVRDPATLPEIAERLTGLLRPGDEVLFLQGDLCRPELLVEIEGVCA